MRAVLLLTVLSVAVPDRPDPSPREKAAPIQQQLLGEWQLTSTLVGGDPKLAKGPPDTVLIFMPGVIQVRENGKRRESDDASYTLDVTKSPTAIDILQIQGPQNKVEGILKVEGDQLTICFAFGGRGSRPTGFASAPKTQNALMQFKRIRK
jgi:uncharacterized protein (TIGR03067 family)